MCSSAGIGTARAKAPAGERHRSTMKSGGCSREKSKQVQVLHSAATAAAGAVLSGPRVTVQASSTNTKSSTAKLAVASLSVKLVPGNVPVWWVNRPKTGALFPVALTTHKTPLQHLVGFH